LRTRLGLCADIALPRPTGADAPASDRHRPVQIRRFQAQRIDQARAHPDYWKPGRPHLDGIDYSIIPNRSTAILAFIAGKFDLTWPYDAAILRVK
jgi:peptide/nickel transport system substrate-binding protein